MALEKIKGKIKEKLEDGKTWADIKLWQLREWAKENPEQAATVICTAIGAGVLMTKGMIKSARIHKEQTLKDRYIYDRSLGSYWKLRRVPTQSERIRIASMRKQGMGYAEILTVMKLL